MNARVLITLKKSIADPQGYAVKEALKSMNFQGVEQVRMGKVVDIEFSGLERDEIERNLERMCENLLANTVIEDYHYTIEGDQE